MGSIDNISCAIIRCQGTMADQQVVRKTCK